MNEFIDGIRATLETQAPQLLMAVAVLIGGWLVALLVAALARKALSHTTLDNKLAAALGGKDRAPDAERLFGRVVFWVMMMVVLVGFFEVLELSAVSGPFRGFLDQIFSFLPQILAAGLLALIAWAVATGVRFAVRGALEASRFDERIGDATNDDSDAIEEGGGPQPLSRTLSDTAYWLIWLLFLPAILGTLELRGLLEPVNDLVGKLMDFLPHLMAAAVIVAIGWFIARVVRRIVTNLLMASGADQLGQRVGMEKALGSQSVSSIVGITVYVLILIPVLIAGLNALKLEAVSGPASEMLQTVFEAIPRIFAAGVLLLLAWVVAKLVSGLVTQLLTAIGFDRLLERVGFGANASSEARTPSALVGTLVMIAVLLFATIEALELLEFGTLAALVASLTVFLGKVALGVVVFGVGLYLADLAARTIKASGLTQASLLSTVARAAIIILAGAMALRQIDVAEDIINLAFGLTLGAVAVAGAISFGIGGRDIAKRYLERIEVAATGRSTGGPHV